MSAARRLLPEPMRHANLGPPPRTCQYPHGHPGEPGFRFCGDPVFENSSYCARHHAVCWWTPEPRQSRLARFAGA